MDIYCFNGMETILQKWLLFTQYAFQNLRYISSSFSLADLLMKTHVQIKKRKEKLSEVINVQYEPCIFCHIHLFIIL